MLVLARIRLQNLDVICEGWTRSIPVFALIYLRLDSINGLDAFQRSASINIIFVINVLNVYSIKIGYLVFFFKSFSHLSRYNLMTTNISESLNYVFKDARGLPICALTEFYGDKLQAWFCERHAAAQSTFTHLTRWDERILKERLELARPLQVIYNFFSFFFPQNILNF